MKQILVKLFALSLLVQAAFASCSASVAAAKRDYSYPDGKGNTNYIYDLTVTNTGSCVINAVAIIIAPTIATDTFAQSWNLQQVDATHYNVINFGNYLAPGQSLNPGFILTSSGTGAVSVSVSSQSCQNCTAASTTATTGVATTGVATTVSATTTTTTTTSTTGAPATTTTGAPATTTTTGTQTGPQCNPHVFLTARQGSTWTESNGQVSQIYDITVENNGACPLTSIQVVPSYPAGASITQKWNLDNNWFVNTYGPLAPQNSYLGAGFVVTGPGPNPTPANIGIQSAACSGDCSSASSSGAAASTTGSATGSAAATTGSAATTTTTSTTGSASTTTTGSSSGCSVALSIAKRVGSQWTEANGQTSQIYDITTTNTGSCTLTNTRVSFTISAGSYITQQWNLDGQYNVNLPNGGFLAPGASYGEAGIVLTGGGSVAVSVANKACNC